MYSIFAFRTSSKNHRCDTRRSPANDGRASLVYVRSQIANLAELRTEAVGGVAGRQYRAARWFLLPEGELPPRRHNGSQIANLAGPRANPAERNGLNSGYFMATISTGCFCSGSRSAFWNFTLPKSMDLRSMQRMLEFHAVL